MNATELTVRQNALAHTCPECGAAPGVRCRIVTCRPARPGYPKGTKVDVCPKPHAGRVSLAWRERLKGAAA